MSGTKHLKNLMYDREGKEAYLAWLGGKLLRIQLKSKIHQIPKKLKSPISKCAKSKNERKMCSSQPVSLKKLVPMLLFKFNNSQ